MAGCAAARWYPDTPENHLPLRLQRHVSDQLRCSKQPRLLRRALPILPPGPLTATAHLRPLAQPTALRHPGFRCDIDSHPDCRPFLILIVAPHHGPISHFHQPELQPELAAPAGKPVPRHSRRGTGPPSGAAATSAGLQPQLVRRCQPRLLTGLLQELLRVAPSTVR